MQTEELKILLALEPTWSISLNGLEFMALPSSEISIQDSSIQLGRHNRRILDIEWVRPNVVRVRARAKLRSKEDVITFYPGDRLPSTMDLRRRRRGFQTQIGPALCAYFGVRKIERQALYSDRQHGIGGAYPRFVVGKQAVIAVDPDESADVLNGLMSVLIFLKTFIGPRLAAGVPPRTPLPTAPGLRSMLAVSRDFPWLH